MNLIKDQNENDFEVRYNIQASPLTVQYNTRLTIDITILHWIVFISYLLQYLSMQTLMHNQVTNANYND